MKEFTERFEKDVRIALEDLGLEPFEFVKDTVKKTNRSYEALTVMPRGGTLGVNIDLTMAFKNWCSGQPYEEIVRENAGMAYYYLHHTPNIQSDIDLSFKAIKSSLTVQIMSETLNRELLEDVPHCSILDLALVYRIVSGDEYSLLITHAVLKEIGVDLETLKAAALENSARMRPPKIQRIKNVLDELYLEMDENYSPDSLEPGRNMYIATNNYRFCGAAVLAYPDFLESAADYLQSSYFILPSSIHELILLPDSDAAPAAELKRMVTAINAAEVDPSEVLTNNVYHYDREEGLLEYGETYEARVKKLQN